MNKLPISVGLSSMFKVQEKSMRIHYLGNRIVFHIPVDEYLIVKNTYVEAGRLTIETLKRLDKDQNPIIYQGPFYPGEKMS